MCGACYGCSAFLFTHFTHNVVNCCLQNKGYFFNIQDPVVQSIVSLTISLRHKFVKQISAKVTNTLLFFVEKMRESFAVQRILTFFNKK